MQGIWALYYVCTEYIAFQFFSPLVVSTLSLGLYYSFAAPLALYFYFSFERYRRWMLSAPFPAVAYGSTLYNFHVLYTCHGVVPYSYRDTYFLLILIMLVCNIGMFFARHFRQRREAELLALQNRQARDSYERLTTHLKEIGGIKHEMKNLLPPCEAISTQSVTPRRNNILRYMSGNQPPSRTRYTTKTLSSAL